MRSKGSAAELEQRRRLAVRRVHEGWKQRDVAAFLGVSERAVGRWVAAERRQGEDGLRARPHPGGAPRLTEAQATEVLACLLRPAGEFGFPTALWTARIGVYANCSGPSTIQNNLFDANNLPGPAGGAAIYSDAGTNGLLVRGNEFKNQALNNPVIFGATAATSNTNLQFLDDSLHDNNFGVFALKVVHGLFEGNTISTTDPGGATALTIADGSSDVQMLRNVFQNNARGLRVMDFGFGVSSGPISGVVVHFNSFINNTEYGLFVDAGSYSGTVNAQNNFWDSPSGPTTPGNPGGTGEKVIGPVDSTAWLITPPRHRHDPLLEGRGREHPDRRHGHRGLCLLRGRRHGGRRRRRPRAERRSEDSRPRDR
jgi:transposase